jgi:hypothetical protein
MPFTKKIIKATNNKDKMNIIDQLNEKDNKTRKNWLFATFASFSLGILWIILKNPVFPTDWDLIGFLSASFVMNILVYWALYSFTYKRGGTKLLTFLIAATVLSIPMGNYGMASEHSFNMLMYSTVYLYSLGFIIQEAFLRQSIKMLVIETSSLIVVTWWLIESIKLRRIYKKMKLLNAVTSREASKKLKQDY